MPRSTHNGTAARFVRPHPTSRQIEAYRVWSSSSVTLSTSRSYRHNELECARDGHRSEVNLRLPAAAAARTVATAATTSGVAPWRRWLGDLDGQCAPSQRRAIELPDRLVRGFGRGHLDEAEAPRPARVTIVHDRDALDAGHLAKELAQFVRGGVEGEAADVKLLTHEVSPDSAVNHAPWNGGSAHKAWTDEGGEDHDGQQPGPDAHSVPCPVAARLTNFTGLPRTPGRS